MFEAYRWDKADLARFQIAISVDRSHLSSLTLIISFSLYCCDIFSLSKIYITQSRYVNNTTLCIIAN